MDKMKHNLYLSIDFCRKKQMLLLSLGTTCIFLALLSLIPLLPPISEELAISKAELGWVAGIFMICMALFQIPFGVLSDKFGRKPMLIIGLLIFSSGVFMLSKSSTFAALLFARAISGIGAAIFFTTSFTMIGDMYRLNERGQAMGILAIATGFGTVLGYSFGGVIGDLYGWRMVFLWLSGFSIIICLLFFFLSETNYCLKNNYCYSDILSLSSNTFKIKNVILVTLIAMLCNMASIGSSYIIPFYAQEAGISIAMTGLIFVPFAITSSIGALLCGKCSDKIGRKYPLVAVTLLSGVALLLFPFLSVEPISMAFNFALVGLCFGPVVTLTSAMLVDQAAKIDTGILGTSMGTFNMIRWMGAAFGPVLGGLLLELYEPNVSLLVFAFMILLAAIISMFVNKI
ncbi:putative MFS family arabinose efflux permease [Methanosalsum natronophilum]|nr:putative MFS family arabinose efflux permease [Methanosalsum natronophilum]